MSDDETMSDDQIVEYVREKMQLAIDRGIDAVYAGKTLPEFFASDPLPSTTLVAVASDLREVGSFDLILPPRALVPRHQWVYERKSDKAVFALSWKSRLALQKFGYTELHAMVDDPSEQS